MTKKKPRPKARSTIGRPSGYTPKVANLICERVAAGESMRAICEGEDMPARSMVFRWLAAHETFRDQYARARDDQCDSLAEEALERGRKATSEDAHAARVHIDAIKWFASKVAPKKYGDKLQVDTTHHHDLTGISDEDIAQELLDRASAAGGDTAKRR